MSEIRTPTPVVPIRHQLTYHMRSEENNVNPDDGSCWSCSACKLPIFNTPFKHKYVDATKHFLHDQCADLPRELKGSVLHPGQTLFLQDNNQEPPQCANCNKECGIMFYYCSDSGCGFRLDVLCALTASIKILHRSHHHRLIVIRGVELISSLICGACGTRHPTEYDQTVSSSSSAAVSYLCSVCSFWIHPNCASLPNIITKQAYHQHPLVLSYSRPDSSSMLQDIQDRRRRCAICEGLIQSIGAYSCTTCHDYYVHIMCAVADPQSFKRVSSGEAQLANVVKLPIPDEYTSVVSYLKESTRSSTTTTTSSSSDAHDNDDGLLQLLHEHPLNLHDHHDDDNADDERRPVCNACVQLIISPPFYRCSECPDFFLHNCCAHLPPTLDQHPAHKQHPLSLRPRDAAKSFLSTYYSICCWRTCNGFSYQCAPCKFDVDLLCAFIPPSITHHAHSNTHILHLFSNTITSRQIRYDCCGISVEDELRYECGTCRNFLIHASCALLPDTIRHKFDRHPIKLNTKTSYELQRIFCEVCENEIDNAIWYYSCDECKQSFHTDCIPYLDGLSRMKFSAASIRVNCHDCHLTLVRGRTVRGYRCGYCRRKFDAWHTLALECSECCFRIHESCAAKCMRKN